MKKVVLTLVAVVVAGMAVVAASTDWRAGAREWPMGLGSVDSIASRNSPAIYASLPDLRAAREAMRNAGLHERWELSRRLWLRSELVAALAALSLDQSIAADPRVQTMPWYDEFRRFERRRAIVAALQTETWIDSMSMQDYVISNDPGVHWLRRVIDLVFIVPYVEVSRLDYLAYQRKVAEGIADGRCAFEELAWWNELAQHATGDMTAVCQRLVQLEKELRHASAR